MLDGIRKSFVNGRECYHGGKFREAILKGAEKDSPPLDFSANINPLGSPPLDKIVSKELENIGYYPDNKYIEFKNAIARFVGVKPENIVPGNGSSEIIRLFAEMVLGEGDLALIPFPTFGEYENQSLLSGARIKRVEIDSKGLPVISDNDLCDAKALFVCNPNNPTGVLISRDDITSLARRCERNDVFLLVDEAFIELSDPDQSIAGLAPEMEYLLVMRSLTKSFGVPGLRLGFGVANSQFAEIMDRARIPWSISSIASAAGVYLLDNAGYLEDSRNLIGKEREWLTAALSNLGLEPLQSSVNFILVNIKPSGLGSDEIAERMAAQGVLVRDCQSFGLGRGYIRVAVRNRAENERLIDALGRVINCAD